MSARVADRVRDVEREVVASFGRRHAQQLPVLLLREVLLEVHVQGRAAGQMLDVAAPVQAELVDDVQRRVLDDIEIGVVAVARHGVAVLAVPLGVLHADVLRGDHLAVEHHLARAVAAVVLLDEPQHLLHEAGVVVVVVDLQPEELRRLDQSVDADGEVLPREVDVPGVEERQHALALQLLEVFVVGQLHLVHQVGDLAQEGEVVHAVLHGVLHAAVEVDRQHALRAGRDAAGAERVAEAVVLDLVAQAAARRERVGVVADVGEERVSLGIHLGREVAPLAVHHVAVAREQRHRLDGEGQHRACALVVEPPHEALLEPRERLPAGARAVREDELPEEALEVVAVVVGDVPEDGLEVARAGGLVDRVDDLLEAVGDDLVDRAAFGREVDDAVGVQVVVLAVLLFDEVVHVHEELGRGARAREHRRDDEDHVDEAAAERLEVGRARRVAADRERAAEQPRVHRDRGAVVGHRRLVVLVDEVVAQQVEVLVGQLLAVHLADAVGEQAAVEPDEVLFGQLADECGDVLVLDVGVGVVFRSRCRVLRIAVVDQEVELFAVLAVFGVFLAVEHVALGHGEVVLGHEGHLDLVLDLLDAHAVGDVHAAQDGRQVVVGGVAAHREECLADRAFDLFHRERLALAVAFDDLEFRDAHNKPTV